MTPEAEQIIAIFWTAREPYPEISSIPGIAGSRMSFEGLICQFFAWHSDALLPMVADAA